MKYRILGDTIQTFALELESGEAIYTPLGTLLFVKGAVKSDTDPEGPAWGNLTDTLVLAGESPLVVYRCEDGGGLIGFQAPGIGRVHIITLEQNRRMIVKRKGIIAATEGVHADRLHLSGEDTNDIEPGLFVTLHGSGKAFLHGGGNLVDFTLGKNESIVVDGEMILALDDAIGYSPKPVGKPDQEGPIPYIMLMHITGPGRLVLHTLG